MPAVVTAYHAQRLMSNGTSLLQTKSSMLGNSTSTVEDDFEALENRAEEGSVSDPKENWMAEKKKWGMKKMTDLKVRKIVKLIALGTIGLVVTALIIFGFCYHGSETQESFCSEFEEEQLDTPAASEGRSLLRYNSLPHTDEAAFKVFGRPVHCEALCDYVLVLPLSGKSKSNLHQTGASIRRLHWDANVDGIKMAKAVFQDPNKAHIIKKKGINQRFRSEMTFEEYQAEVRKLLIETLIGPAFGLEVAVAPSVDHDEIFVRLNLPHNEGTLGQFAQNFEYRMPLSDHAYKEIGQKITPAEKERRAVSGFLAEHAECYQPFRHIDRMRMLKARLDRYLDLNELCNQGIVVAHFMPHSYKEVQAMCKNWANPFCWFEIPSHGFDDSIRNYFGEEVAWMFVWQTYFTRALALPCLVAVVVYLRRFCPDVVIKREIQLGGTVLMMIWCTLFNAFYDRRESRMRQHWGIDVAGTTAGAIADMQVRDEYDPSANDTFTVRWAPFFGDFLATCTIALSIGGVYLIQYWREKIMEIHSHWIWPQLAALMITSQIFIIDAVWRRVSRFIVNCENHRKLEKWKSSWVQKMFVVRIFNNMYPFLYVGFLKQYSSTGCPPTEDGCLGELEMNLLTYFAVRLVAQLIGDFTLLLLVRLQVAHELLKKGTSGTPYTYLQVQAKQLPYDDGMRMDDWTEQVLTFTYVASFNVVLPAISVVALLSNLLEGRLVAHRNACYLRRPDAEWSSGIGAWREILFGIEMLAVIINLGFAIFVMRPLRDFDTLTKWAIFVIAEHVIVVVKLAVRAKFPPTPLDVEEFAEKNQQVVHRLFVDLETHPVNAKVVHQEAPDIGPKAFGGRDYDAAMQAHADDF
jgi:hypothetical protein